MPNIPVLPVMKHVVAVLMVLHQYLAAVALYSLFLYRICTQVNHPIDDNNAFFLPLCAV